MKTTAAALRELQDYWDSLDPKPNMKEIAHMAGMSYSTAARYLNGTTKQGLPDSVRALARALDREDIMDEVSPGMPTQTADAWLILEVQRQAREEYTEQLERERQIRAEKDKQIADLESDKGKLLSQLEIVLQSKRRYERLAIGVLALLAIYFIVFDLPYPDSGITEVLLGLIHK